MLLASEEPVSQPASSGRKRFCQTLPMLIVVDLDARMAQLPSGTVTFVFTDIEGSTALTKRLRDRYGEVLEQHQVLVRAAFEAHGGHEIDTQGDSFFFAFPRAKDAVVAVVEAQRALTGHAWPEGGQVRV